MRARRLRPRHKAGDALGGPNNLTLVQRLTPVKVVAVLSVGCAALAAAFGLLLVCGIVGRPAGETASGPSHTGSPTVQFRSNGVAVSYPSAWHVMPPDPRAPYMFMEFTNLDGQSSCCHLEPSSFIVGVSDATAASFDIATYSPPGATRTIVGGVIFVRETMAAQPSDGFDEHLLWVVGRPGLGKPCFEVSAIFRGPNSQSLESEVADFVASMTVDP
jgi:hypothetical protein